MARTSKIDDPTTDGTVPLVMTIPDDIPDDIPDPVTPLPVVIQALTPPVVDPSTPAGQVVMSVDEALYRFSTHATTVLSSVEKSWDAALRVLNHNNQGVEALAAALTNYVPYVPYSVSIAVVSPAGFPMTFVLQDQTQEGFLAKIGTMMEFVMAQGFTVGAPF